MGEQLYTLSQSARIRGSAGEPLPVVFQALESIGARFVRGQLVLVCAGPGTGKSGFILNYALRAKVPTLYFSADSDHFTQITRSVACLTGCRLEDAGNAVLEGALSPDVEALLGEVPMRLIYDAQPDLDTVERTMMSYEEVYGDHPSLVIVDNITNLSTDSGDPDNPFSGLEALMDYLHGMARSTAACVVPLHHVNGGFNNADKPIPLSGVKGQITRVPEMVLTLHKHSSEFGSDTLCVSPVKNRNGKADPSGETFAELEFIGDQMLIRDFESR